MASRDVSSGLTAAVTVSRHAVFYRDLVGTTEINVKRNLLLSESDSKELRFKLARGNLARFFLAVSRGPVT